MIDTVAELEREISRFKTNIQNSNELIIILGNVISEIKNNNDHTQQLLNQCEQLGKDVPEQLLEINARSQQEFTDRIHSELDQIRISLNAECEDIEESLHSVQKEASENISSKSGEVCVKLEQTAEKNDEY